MNTKKEWIDDQVDVAKLYLDLQNPRVPQHVKNHEDVQQIRNYLLENEDVIEIAKSIANKGYHRTAVAIVYFENSKFVVLDGNRRLAACQLLLNPALAPTARDKTELEKLNKSFDKQQLNNIKIAIAPSRKEADKEIIDIHVNDLSKPWQVLQRLRKYKTLIDSGEHDINSASSEYGIVVSTFKEELQKLYFYETILGLSITRKEEKELLKSGFNKIQRLILSKNGKKLLNYSIDDMGKIIIQDQIKYDEKLKKLVPYIVTPGIIPAQAKQEDLVVNVYSKIDSKLFPLKKKNSKSTKKKKKASRGTSVKADWVSNNEYKSYDGANRVKVILKELSVNRPATKKNNINILAVALRVVIELAIYDKLRSKGFIKTITDEYKNKKLPPNWSPGLKEMLTFMLNTANNLITDPQDRTAINKVMQKRKDFIGDLNLFIHNVSYLPTETQIRDIWNTCGRLIFDIMSKIK
ncbi:MAG: hypothetical protein IIA58_00620 [Candidatus Marinimicrobia bacterium]|nr:hypothetical protein [Candidatus Neomarinimicrobiota bacterium]